MGARGWLVFVGLAGCAWIPLTEHQDHLAELEGGGQALPGELDAFVSSVTPDRVAACASDASVTLVVAVDEGWVGETLQVAVSVDGAQPRPLPDARVDQGAGVGLFQAVVDPLGCDASCEVALELSHASGASDLTDRVTIKVVDEQPSVLGLEVFDEVAADWVPLEGISAELAQGRGAALVSRYPRGRVVLDDPLAGTPWSVDGASVAIGGCPLGDTSSPECVAVVGADVPGPFEAPDADRVVEVELLAIAEAVCASSQPTLGWQHAALISDQACQPDALIPLHDDLFRIVLDDCDADGVDWPEDCDDDDADAAVVLDWYPDGDGDGWGADGGTPKAECHAPAGTAARADDCDDAAAVVFPGNPEICDGLDNDCDAGTAEAGVSRLGVPYLTLRDAILAANTDDPIWVCAGTWTGPHVVDGKDIVVEGIGGREQVLLENGLGGGPVFEVYAGGSLKVTGATLQGGQGGPGPAGPSGGAVYAEDAGALTFDDVVLSGNSADFGGALFASGSGLVTLVASVVTGNEALEDGGGLWIDGEARLEDTVVEGNIAGDQGGGGWADGGPWMLVGAIVRSNVAGRSGGGLELGQGGVLDLQPGAAETVFEANTAVDGAGVHAEGGQVLGAADFLDNTASGAGGALHGTDLTLALTGGLVAGNAAQVLAPAGSGGAFFLDAPTLGSSMVGMEFLGNTAVGGRGGGVFVQEASDLTLDAVIVADNLALDGGGLFVDGGAVALDDATLEGNVAALGTGGGIFVTGGAVVDVTSSFLVLNEGGLVGAGAVAVSNGTWTCDATTGLGAAATDNSPDDVIVYGLFGSTAYNWIGLAGAAITCTSDGAASFSCSP